MFKLVKNPAIESSHTWKSVQYESNFLVIDNDRERDIFQIPVVKVYEAPERQGRGAGFFSYRRYGSLKHYPKIVFFFELLRRIAAIQCLIDFIKIEKSNGIREFEYLLKIVKNDNESLIRYKTLRLLAKNPPFKKMESTLNTSEIRNLLWEIISQFSACDSNVRCAAIHLWKLLYRWDFKYGLSSKLWDHWLGHFWPNIW